MSVLGVLNNFLGFALVVSAHESCIVQKECMITAAAVGDGDSDGATSIGVDTTRAMKKMQIILLMKDIGILFCSYHVENALPLSCGHSLERPLSHLAKSIATYDLEHL